MIDVKIDKDEVFPTGDKEKIWRKFCGFLDLSLEDFMQIQADLLQEQIELMSSCALGRKIMKGQKPAGVEEFRRMIPLTRYEDYEPYLTNKQEDQLAIKPDFWSHSSGRGGQFKWIPYAHRTLEIQTDMCLGGLILACTDRRGEVNITADNRIMCIVAPPPYVTGVTNYLLMQRFGFNPIPPPKVADELEFAKRVELGFNMALRQGVDVIWGVGTVLYKMGEKFAEKSEGIKLSPSLLHPAVIFRLVRALLRSKVSGRAILPSDIWPLKGMACGGTDASVYENKLKHFWGRYPQQVYGCTESGMTALQSWARKGLVFHPYMNFLEFIPEAEALKSKENKEYQPQTVLINQLKPGKIYELVLTNFHGMPFLRYRPGDLFRTLPAEEQEAAVKIPQFSFYSRADDLIDLYSVIRLDERTVWEAINQTGVSYVDWSAKKEYEESWPILKIHFEPKGEINPEALSKSIHENLRANALYNEGITENEKNPVRISVLNKGTYKLYYEDQRKIGADLAHMKPAHMNASEKSIMHLLECSKIAGTK